MNQSSKLRATKGLLVVTANSFVVGVSVVDVVYATRDVVYNLDPHTSSFITLRMFNV